jgi:RNA recognition motif-containing protein
VSFCHIFKDKYGKGRGFGLVIYENRNNRDRALKAKITSMGKNISVLKYIKNNAELEKRDAALSRLKVCILGIPKEITDEGLTAIMQKAFGEIRHCYVRDDPSKNKNIGFVTFESLA